MTPVVSGKHPCRCGNYGIYIVSTPNFDSMQEMAGTGSGFPDRVLPRQQKGLQFRTPDCVAASEDLSGVILLCSAGFPAADSPRIRYRKPDSDQD